MENLLGKRFLGAGLDFCPRKIEEFCGELLLGMVEVFRPPARQIWILNFPRLIRNSVHIGVADISVKEMIPTSQTFFFPTSGLFGAGDPG